MTQNMLTGLIRLRSLDLSSNKLTLIDGALETLITLEQLNLRGNALAVLGPDIFKVKRMMIRMMIRTFYRVS
jgi:Leucine-rich repeat (LRR) protein